MCFETHAEVSVPDLDGAILAACCNELPITAVGAACGDDLLTLKGAGFKNRLVLLLRVQVPCAHSAVERHVERQSNCHKVSVFQNIFDH